MSESTRKRLLTVILVVMVVIGAVVLFRPQKDHRPPPDNSSYYTGPMRNKSNPNTFTTDDGKVVPAPPGTGPPPDRSIMPGASNASRD